MARCCTWCYYGNNYEFILEEKDMGQMSEYKTALEEEKKYLERVTEFLEEQIQGCGIDIKGQRKNLVDIRREMYTEGSRYTDEMDRMAELNQYITMEAVESSQYKHKLETLKKYEKMIDKPYFGRFDFAEEGEEKESIYVGYHNIMNDDTYEVLAYDWRAPIASVFYRSELGSAKYIAPYGEIEGEVSLKRQYEIKKGELEYFFDCSLTITDELLQQALGKNTSSKMKNIVETIQKEQDQIIRDRENDLLIVQGVAGSGKTSIAMHRVAFLLYDRLESGLTHNQIMILSPNHLFGEYISNVLPELGEEDVAHFTVEDIFEKYFGNHLRIRNRNSQMEYIIGSKHRQKVRETIAFKGSKAYIELLDRLVDYCETHMIKFTDIYYDKELIVDKDTLKKDFLDNAINMSIVKRLNRIERTILEKIKPLEKEKRKEVLEEIEASGAYAFEEEHRCKEVLNEFRQEVFDQLNRFIRVNIFSVYKRMFTDEKLFNQLAKGLDMPHNAFQMMRYSLRALRPECVPYEDGVALLYLKLKIEGNNLYPGIRQVVIDEAQDYYPMHYKVFGELFKGAQYTVLGDVCQTIEKEASHTIYDDAIELLNPKRALKLELNKSYRSSYEINQLAMNLREDQKACIAIERHEEAPLMQKANNEEDLNEKVVNQVKAYKAAGLESIAILCKTKAEVHEAYEALKDQLELSILSSDDTILEKGILVMPIYMAKGLEYDGVVVYDANAEHYKEAFDKQLLYIATTRALHRLSFIYKGQISPFLEEAMKKGSVDKA